MTYFAFPTTNTITLRGSIGWASGFVPNYGYLGIVIPSDANFTPSSSQYNNGELYFTSSVPLTLTRNVVLPLTAGGQWTVFNNTTGGQSLQFIGTSGTGFTVSNGSSAIVWTNGTNFYGISGGGSSVTWANDLVNSTSTNQYVSSLSFNGTAGGGTITINGTGTVLQWASNTTPQFNQATVAGTGANAGTTFTVQAQAGQNQTGVNANNNGGNLVLAGGAAGTGGSGAAGTAGFVVIQSGSTIAFYASSADTDADNFVELIGAHSTLGPVRIYQRTQPGTGANAGTNFQVNAQAGQQQTGATANNNGGNLILASGVPGTGGSGAAGVDGYVGLYGSTQMALFYDRDIDADGFVEIMQIGQTLANPRMYQLTQSGTGANAGFNLKINAQAGQQQTGANANNNGGNLVLASGVPGTGGSGAAGVAGNIQINSGNTTLITASPTAISFNGILQGSSAGSGNPVNWFETTIAMSDANYTLTASDMAHYIIEFTGTLSATRSILCPTINGAVFIISNKTTGGQSIVVHRADGADTGVTVTNGSNVHVYYDGTNDNTYEVASSGGGGSFTAGGDLSGTSSSQTVIGIRNNSVPTLPGSGNNSLIWNGSTFSWSSIGTQSVRFTATDSNTFLHWTLDESAAPFANTGSAGTLNLTTGQGTPATNLTGLFGQAVGFNTSTGLTTGNTSVEPTGNSVTVSVWVYMKQFSNNFGTVFSKQYRNDGTYTSPFGSIYIAENNTSDGQWNFGITVSGVNAQVGSGTNPSYKLSLHTWMLLALTYDGATVRVYLNGELIGTTASAGTIDFGTHGPYFVAGGNANVPASIGIVDDIRVENTVRSQSYLQAMYKAGVGLSDVVLIADAQVSPTAAIQGTKISPNFGTQAIVTTGSATLGATNVTSLSTSLITNSGKSVYTGISAPVVSGSGQGAFYFDSTANEFLFSQNAGPYLPMTGRVIHSTITGTSYAVAITDDFIPVDSTSNAITITLPASPSTGETHIIADITGQAATHSITISGNGKNIVGNASFIIATAYTSVALVYNGTNWSII